ncbi:MAG: AAA-like domain-containing protein [Cyanobacteria bacterium P01_D01_bin.56]
MNIFDLRHNDSFFRLRTLVVHSTDIYVPIKIHQSPFNVGLPSYIPRSG